MSQNKSMYVDLNQGNVTTTLFKYAIPLFASSALQAVYNIVDMVVVGKVLGGTGMSAVSIGGELLSLLTFLALGFANAGQVIIAQYVGAGNKQKEIKELIGTMFTFLIGISIVMAVGSYLLRDVILGWLNTPSEAYEFSLQYFIVCIIGLPFIYGYNVVCSILRGMGDSKKPFTFIAIASIINIILDIVCVKYMNMGVVGAAIATVFGQSVSFVASVVYLYKRKEAFGFDFQKESFKITKDAFITLVKLGIPMAIQSAAIHFSKMLLLSWTNAYGVTESALLGIYNKIGMVISLMSQAFTVAAGTMTGQAIGAQNYKRVPKACFTALGSVSVLGVILCLGVIFMPEQLYGIFTDDQTVLSLSAILFWPNIVNIIGAVGRTFAFAIINGSGNSKLNLVVAIIDGVIARIGISYFLGFAMNFGCTGYWMGDAVAGNIPFVIGIVFFMSGLWKTNKHIVDK